MPVVPSLPLKEKIDGFACEDLEDYLQNTPQAVDEFMQFAQDNLQEGSRPHLRSLFQAWVDGVGADPNHPALARLSSLPESTPEPQDKARFALVEKQWMECGQYAPVAVAVMMFQKQAGHGFELITTDPATNQVRWEATSSLLGLPFQERNASCESDGHEGNPHQFGDLAPRRAREWKGPFRMRVEIYEPSPHLKSLRQQAWMSRVLPDASPTPRPPSLRL